MHSPHRVTVRPRTLVLALLALVGCFAFVLAPRDTRAEGSASLLTSGGSRAFLEYRNDFTQNSSIRRRTLVYVWAQSGETLLVSSSANGVGNGRLGWVAPNGAAGSAPRAQVVQGKTVGLIANLAQEQAGPLPNAGGYRPYAIPVGAGQTGIWTIQFVSPDSTSTSNPVPTAVGAAWTQVVPVGYVAAWDVSVRNAAGTTIPGRAYVQQLAMNVGSAGVAMSAQFHLLTRDGFRYRVDANGVQPFGFNFFANNKGFRNASGVPLYRSVALAGSNIHDPDGVETVSDVTHKLFFSVPSADLPASSAIAGGSTWLRAPAPVAPTASGFSFEGVDGTPNQAGSGLGGVFRFTSDVSANFTIGIDLNGDGDWTDAVDRALVGTALAGPNAIPWDGRDGQGAPAPVSGSPSTVRARIQLQGGEVHFPYIDAEDNPAGIVLERQNGASSPDFTVFFDDRALGGSAALAPTGASSAGGAHVWTGGFGDVRGMDTWAYVPGAYVDLANTITIRNADLEMVSKTHAPQPFVGGQPASYTFVVRNNGPDSAYAAAVVDTIPAALTSPTTGAPVLTGGATLLSSSVTGQVFGASLDLPPGATATFTVNGVVSNAATSPVINRAFVLRTDDSGDLDDQGRTGAGNNGKRDTATVIVGVVDLAMDKRHTAPFASGSNGTYTLVVRNLGNAATTSAFTVRDTLPAGLAFVSSSGGGWDSVTVAAPVVTFWRTAPLTAGDSTVTALVVAVGPAAVPGVTNAATVSGGGDGNPGNDRDTDPTVVAGNPDLSIAKSHTGDFTVGQNGTYTIAVSNVGNAPTTGTITVRDTLPAGLTFVSAAGAPWVVDTTGRVVTAQHPGPIAAGGTSSFTLTVLADAAAVPSVDNSATVSGGGDTNPGNDRDTDPTTVGDVADLAIVKTHVGDFVVGRTGRYTITVTNVGAGTTTGVITVRDTLPAGLAFVSGAGLGWTVTASGQVVTATLTDPVDPAGVIAFDIVVNVLAAAAPGVTNAATVSGGGDTNPANDRATDPTVVNTSPNLTMDKRHEQNASVGVPFTWTFVVTNVGSAATTGAITVRDTLPAGFAYVSGGGAPWSVSAAGGVVTATTNAVIAAGDSARFTVTVLPDASAWPGADNAAVVEGGGDDTPDDNRDVDPTPFTSSPDLAIEKQSSGTFAVGQNATYFLDVTNWGTAPTSGTFTVTDTLPAGLTFVSGTGTNWSVSAVGQVVTATRSQVLFPGGANTTRITLTVAVSAPAQPSVTNFATVSGGGDTEPGNNRDGDVTPVGAPDLALDKRHVQNFTVGQNGDYVLVVRNVSAVPTTGTITVRDTLPNGLSFVGATGGGFTPSVAGAVVTFTRAAPIAAGDSAVITLTVLAQAAAAPQITNSATVSGGGDVNPTNDRDSDPTPVQAVADLAITKTHVGAFTNGGTGTYQLVVANVGSAPTAGTITVTDTLPAGLTFASGAGVDWTVGAAGAVVTATRSTALAPAANSTITLTVNVSATASGSLINAAVVSGGGDTNPTNDRDADTTGVNVAADLAITKTHAASFVVGSQGTWTITVTNVGTSPTVGLVTVRDTLPGGVSYLDASGTNWAVLNTSPLVMQHTGTLAPSASASFDVTVLATALGAPSVTNSATVSGGGDTNPANDRASDPTPVVVAPDLAIQKTTKSTFAVGARVTYDLVITNVGSAATTGAVTVTDTLPAGLTYVFASGTGWTFAVNGRVIVATATSAIGVLQTRSIAIVADVGAGALPGVTNTAVVAGGGDVNPTNNRGSVTNVFGNGPDVAVFKRHTGEFVPAQPARWTITVRNVGVQATTDSVQVADALPAGVQYVSASGAGWVFFWNGSLLRATRGAVMAPGDSASFDVNVAVRQDAPATLQNVANVATVGDVNLTNNAAVDVANVAGLTPLVVEKTASPQQVEIGGVVDYRVTVRNTGGVAVTNVSVDDVLPPGFRYVEGSTRRGGVVQPDPLGAPGPSLSFDAGTVSALETVTITYRVAVGAGTRSGSSTNVAVASSPDGGAGGTSVRSNTAAAAVQVVGGVFGDLGIIAGKVWSDCDCGPDGRQGREEVGIPGVRVMLEDGTSAITDAEGKYSFANVRPRLHVLRVDERTLPPGAVLKAAGTRFAGDGRSRFVDLKAGEFHRADFVEGSRSESVRDAIRARRTKGEPWAAMSESDSGHVEFEPAQGWSDATALGLVVPKSLERGVPADGRSSLGVGIRVPAAKGDQPVTLEASAGRWITVDQTPVADLDSIAPGVQVKVEVGAKNPIRHYAFLQAPAQAQDVKIRVTQGEEADSAVVRFVPEVRPLTLSGVLEGRVDMRSLENGDLSGTGRDRFEDALRDAAFDDQDGKLSGGARGAVMAKGEIGNGVLLTGRWDSERDPDARLFRDIRPFEGYDVLGDASQHEWDAQSRSRLYLRLDKDASFAQFGDFTTPSRDARKLGAFTRSLNGGRARLATRSLEVDGFASQGRSRQVVDEIRGRGVSGPYALSRPTGLLQSEQVELVTRDRSNPARVLSTKRLTRFTDYTIEPFTGALMFRRPISSLDQDLNPVSIRVTYETDSTVEEFWTYGGAAKLTPDHRVELGLSASRDEDPARPGNLASVDVTLRPLAGVEWTSEFARSDSGSAFLSGDRHGQAWRSELTVNDARVTARLFAQHAETGFDNPSSAIGAGRRELGASVRLPLGANTSVFGAAIRTEALATGGKRDGFEGGLTRKLGAFTAEGAYRWASETASAATPPSVGARLDDVQSLRGKLSAALPLARPTSFYGEVEQDLGAADRRRWGVGGDVAVTGRTRVYLRHENIASFAGPFALNEREGLSQTVIGVASDELREGHVFSEYRARSAFPGRETEAAMGVRNAWVLAPGVRVNASFEQVTVIRDEGPVTLSGSGGGGEHFAYSGGVEVTRDPDTKATARVEIRHQESAVTGSADAVLGTLGLAHKFDRDWALLGRASVYDGSDNTRDARLQMGAAWRPTDGNGWNALGRMEARVQDDGASQRRSVGVLSAHANGPVGRRLTLMSQAAGRWSSDESGTLTTRTNAQLLSARGLWELTPRWDAGLAARGLFSDGFAQKRFGAGAELGMVVAKGLRASAGWNVFGFRDADLAGFDHTDHGPYLQLGFKFHEDFVRGATAEGSRR